MIRLYNGKCDNHLFHVEANETEKVSQNCGLTDYKFYCFNGKVKLLMIASDRFINKQTRFDYFDRNFNWLDMTWGKPNSTVAPTKPELFEEMIHIAERLSIGFSHVRVDLYLSDHHIYFGEMTFFDGSGLTPMYPQERDTWLGKQLLLPEKTIKVD